MTIKQREIKIEPRIKLNPNIYIRPHLKDICQGPVVRCCLNTFTLVIEERLPLIYEDRYQVIALEDYIFLLSKWQL